MTVTAYDAGNNLLATFIGAATNQSNAEFTITSATSGISYITISDDSGNADFVSVDDLSYTITPEPGSFMLFGSGALGLIGMLRRKLVS
jgi:hypothetical protein